MINYVIDDVFKSTDDVLVHGCNCFCTMRSGVAGTVSRYYPEAYDADCKTVIGDESKVGTYTSWTGNHIFHDKQITIVNAYTQHTYGYTKSFVFADYDGIKKVMTKIHKDFKGKTICMPKIGAGLAGGDWKIIEKILLDVFNDTTINVYVLE